MVEVIFKLFAMNFRNIGRGSCPCRQKSNKKSCFFGFSEWKSPNMDQLGLNLAICPCGAKNQKSHFNTGSFLPALQILRIYP